MNCVIHVTIFPKGPLLDVGMCVTEADILHDDVIKWKHVTGPLWEESIGDRWVPLKKPVTRCFGTWTNGRANNQDAGDLRRHRVHHDVIVMWKWESNDTTQKNMGLN